MWESIKGAPLPLSSDGWTPLMLLRYLFEMQRLVQRGSLSLGICDWSLWCTFLYVVIMSITVSFFETCVVQNERSLKQGLNIYKRLKRSAPADF